MTASSTASPAAFRAGYRPELDGLRTVAVMLILAFHAGIGWMTGGFLGVDVFFVLSGFLITGLLVGDHSRGTFALASFYARRARRLLPAAMLVILAISITWVLTTSVIERAPLQGDATSAALYYSNWHFAIQGTDYFAAANAPSPFLHFWSLSVEEQFYLVWPAAVALTFGIARRTRRSGSDPERSATTAVLLVAAVLTALSLFSLWWTGRSGNASLAYFGTPNRAYQLLAGAGLAVVARRVTHRRRRRGVNFGGQAVALACLFVLATSAVTVGPSTRGVLTAAATLALLWTLERGDPHPVARLLGSRLMTALGKVSYGVYLWHWPVLLLLRKFTTHNALALFTLGTVISIVLAEASNRLLELPIRTSSQLGRRPGRVLTAGLAISVAVGLVLAPQTLALERRPVFVADRPSIVTPPVSDGLGSASGRPGSTVASDPLATTPVPPLDELKSVTPNGPIVACLPNDVPGTCLVHRGSSGRTLLVIGDSHLGPFRTTFADLGVKYDITVHVWLETGCPWERGLYTLGPFTARCVTQQRELYDATLPNLRPDSVMVINAAYEDPNVPRALVVGDTLERSDPVPALIEAIPTAIARMMTYTQQFVILHPWPSTSFNQRDCLAKATYVGECAALVNTQLPSDPTLFATARDTHGVSIIDLNDVICPRLPICDAVVQGEVVRWDKDHLSDKFVPRIAGELERQLVALGVFG